MVKVAFVGVKSWEKELLEKKVLVLGLKAEEVGFFEEEVDRVGKEIEKAEVLSPFIYSKVDKKILDRMPSLRLVATRSTGVDHIDLKECKRRGIKVFNVPEYGSVTVAEAALALMMAVTKKTALADRRVREGKFSPEGLTGVDLLGRVLVVVGVGRIGAHMVRIGEGLGMRVIGVDSRGRQKTKRLRSGEWRGRVRLMSLEKALALADVVSLHLPYTPETHHLISKERVRGMKKGAYLINTSRGPVVETEALLWGLDEGILAGVGLDVIEEEARVEEVGVVMGNRTKKDDLKELVAFHLLRERPEVVMAPHNAFNTKEAIERIVEATMENIRGGI